MIRIAPSMLAADFLHLEESCKVVNDYADIFHLDIMDGSQVPNISFGFPVVEAIAEVARKPLDAHLMIVNPEKYIDRFAAVKGMSMISFHFEATAEPLRLIEQIHSHGIQAGIAFNPDVPVESLFPLIPYCDFLLCMSVFAGFGGQKFIPETLDRLRALKEEIVRTGSNCELEVDGGVGESNAKAIAEAGASILVAGSAVFKADDPAAIIASLRQ